jgi:uncharacterized NAD(P)/FAD-binding protein YdhS
MPNLDPWINQNEKHMAKNTINKFEKHLLSIKVEHQKRIRPNLHHPAYNERHQKIIELIDSTLEKYKKAAVTNIKKITNRMKKNTKVIY